MEKMSVEKAKAIVSKYNSIDKNELLYLEDVRAFHDHKLTVDDMPIWEVIAQSIEDEVRKAQSKYFERVEMVRKGAWISAEDEKALYEWKKAIVSDENGNLKLIDLPPIIPANSRTVYYDEKGQVWVAFIMDTMVRVEDYDKVRRLCANSVEWPRPEDSPHGSKKKDVLVGEEIKNAVDYPLSPLYKYARTIQDLKLAKKYFLQDRILWKIRKMDSIRFSEGYFSTKKYSFEYNGRRYTVEFVEKDEEYRIMVGRDGHNFRISKNTYRVLHHTPARLFQWLAETVERRIKMRGHGGGRGSGKRKIDEKVEAVRFAPKEEFVNENAELRSIARCYGKWAIARIVKHAETGLFALMVGLSSREYRSPESVQTIAVFRKKKECLVCVERINYIFMQKVKQDYPRYREYSVRNVEFTPDTWISVVCDVLRKSKATLWAVNEEELKRVMAMFNIVG